MGVQFLIQFFLINLLIVLLTNSNKPVLCSGIYSGLLLFKFLLPHDDTVYLAFEVVITFTISTGYFWLLNRLEDSSTAWWLIALGGLLLLLYSSWQVIPWLYEWVCDLWFRLVQFLMQFLLTAG